MSPAQRDLGRRWSLRGESFDELAYFDDGLAGWPLSVGPMVTSERMVHGTCGTFDQRLGLQICILFSGEVYVQWKDRASI